MAAKKNTKSVSQLLMSIFRNVRAAEKNAKNGKGVIAGIQAKKALAEMKMLFKVIGLTPPP